MIEKNTTLSLQKKIVEVNTLPLSKNTTDLVLEYLDVKSMARLSRVNKFYNIKTKTTLNECKRVYHYMKYNNIKISQETGCNLYLNSPLSKMTKNTTKEQGGWAILESNKVTQKSICDEEEPLGKSLVNDDFINDIIDSTSNSDAITQAIHPGFFLQKLNALKAFKHHGKKITNYEGSFCFPLYDNENYIGTPRNITEDESIISLCCFENKPALVIALIDNIDGHFYFKCSLFYRNNDNGIIEYMDLSEDSKCITRLKGNIKGDFFLYKCAVDRAQKYRNYFFELAFTQVPQNDLKSVISKNTLLLTGHKLNLMRGCTNYGSESPLKLNN